MKSNLSYEAFSQFSRVLYWYLVRLHSSKTLLVGHDEFTLLPANVSVIKVYQTVGTKFQFRNELH